MHCSALVVLAIACAAFAVPAPVEDVVNVPITGVVTSSRNTTTVYAGVPVRLYNSDKDSTKLDLVETLTTSETGKYTFVVPHASNYQVCAFVNGFEACVFHHVPAVKAGDRNRRITSLSSLNIPVPSNLGVYEYEIQVIWTMDNTAYACDWDTALYTNYDGNCLAANKDTYSYGFCCDPTTVDCDRNALVYQDSNCANSAFGFESLIFAEPGTGTYKHFVYGWGLASSFDTITSLSQGQINVYRRGLLGAPYLEKTILLTNSVLSNSHARFWHTFTLNVSGGSFGSISETNLVQCTPQTTTGSTATLTMEHGPRGC